MLILNRKIVLVALVLLALVLAGCAAAGAPKESENEEKAEAIDSTSENVQEEPQEKYFKSDNGEGGVQVEALWVTPDYVQQAGVEDAVLQKQVEESLVFGIFMTTHGGDLLQEYDVLQNVELLVDGRTVRPVDWELDSNDGHHPSGRLVFPKEFKDGETIINNQTTEISLLVKNLRRVPERTFIWEIPSE